MWKLSLIQTNYIQKLIEMFNVLLQYYFHTRNIVVLIIALLEELNYENVTYTKYYNKSCLIR